jgi:hypothetical protein
VNIVNQIRRRPPRVVALAAAVALAATLTAAPAQAQTRSLGAEAGLGFASFFSTLPYGIVKVVWALVGTLGSGMAWCFTGGNGDVATAILDGAVRGDYVLTPDHLTGKEGIDFIGRSPENQRAQQQQQQGEPAW